MSTHSNWSVQFNVCIEFCMLSLWWWTGYAKLPLGVKDYVSVCPTQAIFLSLPQFSQNRLWLHHDLDQDKSVTQHECMNKSCQLCRWQMARALVSLQDGTVSPCFLSSGCGSLEKQSMLGKNRPHRHQFLKSTAAIRPSRITQSRRSWWLFIE